MLTDFELEKAGQMIREAIEADPGLADHLIPGWSLIKPKQSRRKQASRQSAVLARSALAAKHRDHAQRTEALIAGIYQDYPGITDAGVAFELNKVGHTTWRGNKWRIRYVQRFRRMNRHEPSKA